MADAFENEQFRNLLRVHSRQALLILYEHYSAGLYKTAFKLARNKTAAFDIVQDTFLAVWDNRKDLVRHHEISIERYLAKIVRNKAVSYYKRKRHAELDMLTTFMEFASEEDTSADLIQKELYLQFRSYITQMPQRQREVIELRIDRHLAPEQIASELGVSRSMVEASYTRALKNLKEWALSLK